MDKLTLEEEMELLKDINIFTTCPCGSANCKILYIEKYNISYNLRGRIWRIYDQKNNKIERTSLEEILDTYPIDGLIFNLELFLNK